MGADKEDIIQEGMIGLYKAIRDFDGSKTNSFKCFAEICITRQIITAIKIKKNFIIMNIYAINVCTDTKTNDRYHKVAVNEYPIIIIGNDDDLRKHLSSEDTNKYIKGKEMMNMRKSCMNTTYGVAIGTLLGREKMKEIRKSVSDKKSKKK